MITDDERRNYVELVAVRHGIEPVSRGRLAVGIAGTRGVYDAHRIGQALLSERVAKQAAMRRPKK